MSGSDRVARCFEQHALAFFGGIPEENSCGVWRVLAPENTGGLTEEAIKDRLLDLLVNYLLAERV